MSLFRNILYLMDPGNKKFQGSFDRAILWAAKQQAHLTVAHCLPGARVPSQKFGGPSNPGGPEDSLHGALLREMDYRLAPFKAQGLDIDVKLLTGIPHLAIIQEVLRSKIDMLIMSPHTEQLGRRHGLGFLDMKLVRKCPIPVWIIQAWQIRPFARILVALDLEALDPVKEELAAALIEQGRHVAAQEHATLHILHVWPRHIRERLRSLHPTWREQELLAPLRESVMQHRNAFERMIAQAGLEKRHVRMHFTTGEPAECIVKYIKQHRIDLVLLGSMSRTDIAGFQCGMTAEQVLGATDCSVMALKPAGFATPVSLDTI